MFHNIAPVILIVDDEALVRMIAADIIAACGATVIEAQDGDEAIDIVRNRDDIALLFTDFSMPGSRNGLELAREVHILRPEVEIIVTSSRERVANVDLPDHGTFLPKPYGDRELCTMIEHKLSAL